MSKNKKNSILLMIIFTIILVITDQLVKIIADNKLDNNTVNIIEDFFSLELVYNYGAAFGILENSRLLFCILTSILVIILEYFYIRIPITKKNRLLKIDIVLCIAGAIGNLVDRIKFGYVIDYLAFDFGAYSFPRLNLADIFICVSAGLFFVLIIFYYKDEELNNIWDFIKRKKKDKE